MAARRVGESVGCLPALSRKLAQGGRFRSLGRTGALSAPDGYRENMGQPLRISPDGVFELGSRAFRIPERFARRHVLSYRVLVEPMEFTPHLKPLSVEQRIQTRKYLSWRAAACLIPHFREMDPKLVSLAQLDRLHDWIVRHRPGLLEN